MSLAEIAKQHDDEAVTHREAVFQVKDLAVSYGGNVAIHDVNIDVFKNAVTAFIGPSGCGKSTFIRCFNRMNDLVPSARVDGDVLYHGKDLYATTSTRSRCGAGSGWSSRSRTRSRSRSTTTSPSGRACSG